MPRIVQLSPAAGERLYTIAEVAELWGLSRDTIERLLARGELRYVSIGARRRRIPASALDEYVDSNAGA
jgi:excisionase family DNA binding protein